MRISLLLCRSTLRVRSSLHAGHDPYKLRRYHSMRFWHFARPRHHVLGRLKSFLSTKAPQQPRSKLLLSSLTPAAFIQLCERENDDGKTSEEQMLEVSTAELNEEVPEFFGGSNFMRNIYFFVEDYVIEPFMTGVRFVHLAIIFVPVLLSVPALWLGARLPNHDNERGGALWWYSYLVWSMEKAGASFIKVCS